MSLFDDLPDIMADVLNGLNADEGLGFTITYTSVTGNSYDPATGVNTPATSVEVGVLAFEDNFTLKEIAAGLVQATDQAILIPAENLAAMPKPSDTVLRGGATLVVFRVRDTTPGASSVIHQLHLRAA
jgi:hypothetical protein